MNGITAAQVGTHIGVSISKQTLKRLDALTASVLDVVGGKAKQLYEDWSATFGEHLQITFDRCSKLKTILHAEEPADLLSQYVNMRLKCNDKVFDDISFIGEIWKRKNVIVSGTGGGGKTILMKYLWISFFENPQGKVPIFIELRGLNGLSAADLKSFVYHTVVSSRAKVTQDAFNRGIQSGLFILMFDGFDEIIEDKRADIGKQIIDLAQNNPETLVIISSRPDDRFDGWQTFSNFRVLPLEKMQVVQLIEKLDYDKDIKKIFLKRIKDDLYKRHQSFLSTPLLSIMMLMTFNQFADIPEKIHVFYEQAFDTLFARHDAIKGGYKRKNKTGLAIHDFKRLFSYFCLISYYSTKYEFDEAELTAFLKKAIAIDNAKVKPGDFLSDLMLCVCVVQKDGLKYTFSHRSFQEFFSAYSLAHFNHQKMDQILERLIRRPFDSVVTMLHDMNPTILEDTFFLPRLRLLVEKLNNLDHTRYLESYLATYKLILGLMFHRETAYFHSDDMPSRSDDSFLAATLMQIYSDRARLLQRSENLVQNTADRLWKSLMREMPDGKKAAFVNWQVSFRNGHIFVEVRGKGIKKAADWLEQSDLKKYFQLESNWLVELLNFLTEKQKKRLKKIDHVFGL